MDQRSSSSAKRRVAILNHFAVPRQAPGGTRHAELASHFGRWQATIVSSRRNMLTGCDTEFESSFRPVWTFPYSRNGPSRVLNWISFGVTGLFAGLRAGQVDLVMASSPHLLAGLSGWVLARIRRVPFLLEVRDLWPDVLVDMGSIPESSPVIRGLRKLETFLYGRAKAVVVFTDGVAQRLVDRGVASERVAVIPNGADPSDFQTPTTRQELRERYGFHGFTLVYTGAHGPANGLDLVLDAAEDLRVAEPSVGFVLVGDGVVKAELIQRARQGGLDNVRFMDPVPKSEIPAILKAADAGLHALADVALFRFGVNPNKLYDYMAAGLPVVTNTPGEVTALLRSAGAGIAVAPDGLAKGALALARSSPEQRGIWSRNGREWMSTNRSRRALASRLEDVFDMALER